MNTISWISSPPRSVREAAAGEGADVSSTEEPPEGPAVVSDLLAQASDEVRQVVEATYRVELANLHMGSPPNRQIIADIVSAIQGIVN